MPQAGWTASRAPRMREQVEQTPRGGRGNNNAMDLMQVDPPATEGRVTRSQSRTREKYAPFSNSAMKEVKNSSHASVSLLTPRVKSHSKRQSQESTTSHQPPRPLAATTGLRRTSLLAIEQAKSSVSSSSMEIEVLTPKVSHVFSNEVLGAYNYVKENHDPAGKVGLERAVSATVRGAAAENRGGAAASRRSSIGGATAMKGKGGSEPMSVLKNSVVGGMRARQVHEDMERGGGDEGSGSRIMVYVRLRPMSKKEKESGARSCVKVDNNRDVYLTEMALETDYLRLKRLRGRHFAFDAAFPDNTSQQEVYNTSTANLVRGVLEGRNASVFCYGATGAGKTHTMLGTVQHPGVMVLALKDLFAKLKQRSTDGDHAVRLSYLEVYNESVRDLLSPGRPLVLREDSRLGIVAAGLTQYQAYSADEIMTLLHKGNSNRQTEATRANETSSRSHAILQVIVEYKVQQESAKILRVGKLSLIDLAGSERALATDTRTLRSVEGANINRSLLALSGVINALVEGKKHIPFRNSKLTQLLKDSLGGACETAMIANISPSNGSFGETQNTLHWADRAKEIRTKACEVQEELQVPESKDEQAKLFSQMQRENQMLKLHLARLEQKYLSSNGVNATQATPSSAPFTPMVTAAHANHHGEPLPQVETMARRGEAKTMEQKKIWELQRTVELLEMEAEKTRRDSALREEKMNASILALTRDHTLQLKRKDEIIRNLNQSKSAETPIRAENVAATPIKGLEKILQQRAAENTCSKPAVGGRADQEISRGAQQENARRFVTPKVANNKACPLPPTATRSGIPKPETKTSPRVTRMMARTQTPAKSPAKTPTKTISSQFNSSSKCFSPSKVEELASCRKRTFWDITNSPNNHLGRSLTASTMMGGSSQLRQPGLARRRTSPEHE
ncbi:unnamed protein product [Calypogeia fissa]